MVNVKGGTALLGVGNNLISGVNVAGAVGDEDHRVIPEWVFRLIKIENAAHRKAGIIAVGHLILVFSCQSTSFGTIASAATLKIDKHFIRYSGMNPKGIRSIAGAASISSRFDFCPTLGKFG